MRPDDLDQTTTPSSSLHTLGIGNAFRAISPSHRCFIAGFIMGLLVCDPQAIQLLLYAI